MTDTIQIRTLENGTVTISGLRAGDLRLMSSLIADAAWPSGDKGGPRTDAIERLSDALLVPVMVPDLHGPMKLTCATADPDDLYREIDPDTDQPYPY